MADLLGLGPKEQNFLNKWSKIRRKGMVRYIITRGFLYGLLLFAVWLIGSAIDIRLSEFEQALFTWSQFLRSCVLWFIVELLIGFTLSFQSWRGRESKYRYLS
ncbi:MAG: hypothetical protein K0R57_4888 [Paenibacillaceae bacterium]|jgi:uncharacterized protein involved in cysteine biosynthesis|nr:hypothetical protein [Paenibacillaceae bacterium]